MPTTIWDSCRRIVLERGIEFVKDGGWNCPLAEVQPFPWTVGKFSSNHELSPVLVELEHPSPEPMTMLLPVSEGRMLDIRVQDLMQTLDPKKLPFLEILNLQYVAAAVVYHCKNLAEAYVRIVRAFKNVPTPESDRVLFQFQIEPFFEFDSLITAGIRTLDTVRKPLWRLYGNAGSTPRSFRRALDKAAVLPLEKRESIESIWAEYCAHAKEYRDCIQHYVAPGADRGFADMRKLDPGVWSMSAWLPDNPEVRSHVSFRFDGQKDLLKNGWYFANSTLDIVDLIVEECRRPN